MPTENARSFIRKFGLEGRSWIPKEFHGVLHYHYPLWRIGFGHLKRYFGFEHRIALDTFRGDRAVWFWHAPDMARVRDLFLERCRRNPASLGRLEAEWRKRSRVLERATAEFRRTELSALGERAFTAAYRALLEAYLAEFSIAIGVQDPFSMTAGEFLYPHFERVLVSRGRGKTWQRDFELLTSPKHLSLPSQEKIARAALAKKIRNLRAPTARDRRLLRRHAERFYWLHNSYAVGRELTGDDFLSLIAREGSRALARAAQNLQAQFSSVQEKKRALRKRLSLDSESRLLLRVTETFAAMQDERKALMQKVVACQHRFVADLARRLRLPLAQVLWTHPDEVRSLLRMDRRRLALLLKQRAAACLFVATNLTRPVVMQGAAAKAVMGRLGLFKEHAVREVRGNSAYVGSASGTARVIRTPSDFPKFRTGDVLVASMTRPEMVPLMKFAAAVVTDEGGITSHAAIVSRELKKPCIIGTRHATRTIHDGDFVKVDGKTGVVKILKRAQG